jgi:hypothetical protein
MSQINQRLVFRNAVKSMVKAGVDPRTAVLSQSYLRLERTVATNVASYQFGVLVNETPQGSTIQSTENRLNLQDSFFVSSISAYIGYQSPTDTATNFPLFTYPNPHIFKTGIAGATSTAKALYNMYNGYLSCTVNNRTILTNWDMYRHFMVPQTQQLDATFTATTINVDQQAGNSDATYSVEPNIVLIGSKNNNLSLTMPGAISNIETTSGTVTKIVLILRGVLAQNSTVVS